MRAELKALLDDYLKLLKTTLRGRLISVCLFGSAATGEYKEGSDLDLLIVAQDLPPDIGSRIRMLTPLKPKLRRLKSYREAKEAGLPTLLSEVILTPEEVKKHPPILLDLTHEGVILYDREAFLKKELESLQARLKELKAQRVRGRKGWYWLLKPDAKLGEVVKI